MTLQLPYFLAVKHIYKKKSSLCVPFPYFLYFKMFTIFSVRLHQAIQSSYLLWESFGFHEKLQVDIIAPSWIPPGILNIKVMLAALAIMLISMDKKFIMMIMNFIYEFH